jgi:hypothetical protein
MPKGPMRRCTCGALLVMILTQQRWYCSDRTCKEEVKQ